MSLVVAIADSSNLWIAADTLALSTAAGPLPDPVKKIRLFGTTDDPMVIAIAGESEINGEHLFSHIKNYFQMPQKGVDLDSFVTTINREWEQDIETFDWKSEQNRTDYMADARISIFVASRWDSVAWLDGTFNNLKTRAFAPPTSVLAFGKPRIVQSELEQGPPSFSEWSTYLARVFTKASKDPSVGGPIDLVKWANGGRPTMSRLALNELGNG